MNEILKFNELSVYNELEKNFYVDTWNYQDVCDLLKIDNTTLEYLIERTATKTGNDSIKKSFNKSVLKDSDELTIIGLYLVLKYSCELKKFTYLEQYVDYFREKAIYSLLYYFGNKKPIKDKKPVNKKNSEAFKAMSTEDIMELKAKKFDPSLKVPDLNIEDKSHLFYNKKIVITGVFHQFPRRQEMAEWVKKVGGDNNGSVSSKTDFVVIGNNAGPKKLETIKKHNIKTLTELEFLNLFPNNKPKFI